MIAEDVDGLEDGVQNRMMEHLVAVGSKVAANLDKGLDAANSDGQIVGGFEVLPNNMHGTAGLHTVALGATCAVARRSIARLPAQQFHSLLVA